MNEYLDEFNSDFGIGQNYASVPAKLLAEYDGSFQLEGDPGDLVSLMWKTNGFQVFRDGLLWLVNPEGFQFLGVSISRCINRKLLCLQERQPVVFSSRTSEILVTIGSCTI